MRSAFRRARNLVLGLVAAVGLTACVSKPRCGGCCHEEWVPAHTETVLRYERQAPVCRPHQVGEYALCRQVIRDTRPVPVTQDVAVADRCPVLVPVCEPQCVPQKGYVPVTDYKDRLCPTYTEGCVPRICTQVRACVGVNLSGYPWPVYAGIQVRDVQNGMKPGLVPTGNQHVERVACGEHMEQVVVGQRCCPVQVGSREATVVTGYHLEKEVVGMECRTEVLGEEYHVVQKGSHCKNEMVQPSRLVAVPTPVTVPGYWIKVCDTGEHVGGETVSRAEYESRKAAAR
jgi:hypothetical protein